MSFYYYCLFCKFEFMLIDKIYCCDNNYSFDIVKEGYVNLLFV